MDAAKLEALDGLVTEVDGESPGQQAEQQAQAKAELDLEAGAREWGMIAFVVGNGLAMIAPELKQVYTDDACLNWGRSMMPVAEKYGWNSPAAIPELGLAIATLGLAVPSVLAVRARVQALKAARSAAGKVQRETAEAAAADAANFGGG